MKRLVFITQSVDPLHPVLAATIPKLRALASRVDELVVLAQTGDGEGLPENVEVHTFGADTQLGRGWTLERELVRALPSDAVVAHMIPMYVLLAAPIVRPRGIPLLLWYTHWKASSTLRVAEKLATGVISVDRRSFPIDSPKVRAIGHGIDVTEFPCAPRNDHDGVRALVLGRYSPAKGIPTILEAVREVEGVEVELHGTALSPLEESHRRELERLGFPLGDVVPRSEVPELFARSDLLVNNMEAGSPDKVVYEAAAGCLPVLASNPVFDELFDGYPLSFERNSAASLADRLRWFAGLSGEERAEIGRTLRERVERGHSVDSWADGVVEAAS